jgi:hypothetical protein
MNYINNCINWPSKDIPELIKMIDSGRIISWKTFRERIGKENYQELSKGLGYPCGKLKLETDYAVSFYTGFYKKQRVYWCNHSAIEYVFGDF